MRVEEGFQFPVLANVDRWEADASFRIAVVRHLTSTNSLRDPKEISRLVEHLRSFSKRVSSEYAAVSATMHDHRAEPYLVQYDAWGKRIDKLVTHSGWKELKGIAAKECIVGESYDYNEATGGGRSKLGGSARVFAFARSIMFGPVSKVVLCPISMSDGAARVLELYGTPAQKKIAIPRLLSRDPVTSWTAGQWMTERPGGSDVSRTETTATPIDPSKTGSGDKFVLNGFKWFSSATDGDIALALARTDPSQAESSRGLSLFLIRVRDEQTGKLNGIRVHRLKNKMGTKYLPTAELDLENCVGELVGELGRGVATISSVLNITRLYSACGALSGLGHGLQVATSFAQNREVMQGKRLSSLPLHTATLLNVTVLYRALLQLFFHTTLLMGKSESGTATEDETLRLRFLTPAVKAFNATRSSEGYITLIESLGGQGYQTETGLPEALMDLTVERIWEGTPAVLSLDLLRVMTQSRGKALSQFIQDNVEALKGLPSWIQESAAETISILKQALLDIGKYMQKADMQQMNQDADFRLGRPLLDCVMTTQAGVLLLQQASWRSDPINKDVCSIANISTDEASCREDVEVAQLWVQGGHGDLPRCLASLQALSSSSLPADIGQRIVYGSQSSSQPSPSSPAGSNQRFFDRSHAIAKASL